MINDQYEIMKSDKIQPILADIDKVHYNDVHIKKTNIAYWLVKDKNMITRDDSSNVI